MALSGLAVTSVILLVGNTLGSRIENSQASIIGHPSGREWNQALFHDFGSQVLFRSHLLLLGKFECGGGTIFKVVLEC